MSKFHAPSVPVVAEWDARDGDAQYLGHPAAATLDVRLDVPRRTASFKLRAIASLKPFDKRVSVYLFIRPERVISLTDVHGPVKQPVKDGLIRTRKCPTPASILSLRFALEADALMAVGPPDASTPPLPKTGPSARILDSLRSARGATTLTLHIARSSLTTDFFDALDIYLNERRLRQAPGEVESLYNGKGGKEMQWPADAADATRGESPPSYDELGPPPPPARKRLQSARASPDREERPRKKANNEAEKANSDVEKAINDVEKAPGSESTQSQLVQSAGREWSSGVDQRMTLLSDQLDALKKALGAAPDAEPVPTESLSTRLARLEGHMQALRDEVAEANTRWQEVAERLRDQADLDELRNQIWDDVDQRLAEEREELSEETEYRIDERLIATQDDLRKMVQEELETVEERVKEDLSKGAATVFFEFPE